MSIKKRRIEAAKKEIRDAVNAMLEAHERELLARQDRGVEEAKLARAFADLCGIADDGMPVMEERKPVPRDPANGLNYLMWTW